MIKPGEPWGVPTDATADFECRGDDAALAATVSPDSRPSADGVAAPLVRFHPVHSELARSIGLAESVDGVEPGPARGIELSIDVIATDLATDLATAVNNAVFGVLPTRLRPFHRRRRISVRVDGRELFSGAATTVVVANGQFIDGADVVPRGHPGDGRLEVQVYALRPSERGPMRRRLPNGTHLPHPRIIVTTGRAIEISELRRPWPATLDRRTLRVRHACRLRVVPGAIRLLI